ncbi:MAG: hypothetical protein QNL04_13485, partial [SAR324 cluster bacterium]|nr:hypothetical protein [SAR324 cluster bacterium]
CSPNLRQNSGVLPSGFHPAEAWEKATIDQTEILYFSLSSGPQEIKPVLEAQEQIFAQLEKYHIFSPEPGNFSKKFRRIFYTPLRVYWVQIRPKKSLQKEKLKANLAKVLGCRALSLREFAFYFHKGTGIFDEGFTQAFHLGLVEMAIYQKHKPLYPKIFSPLLAKEKNLSPALQVSTLNLLAQRFPIKNKSQGFILCLPNP